MGIIEDGDREQQVMVILIVGGLKSGTAIKVCGYLANVLGCVLLLNRIPLSRC